MAVINTNYTQGINSMFQSYGSSFNTYAPSVPNFSAGVGMFGQNLASASASTKAFLTDVKKYANQLGAATETIVAGQPPAFSQMIAVLNQSGTSNPAVSSASPAKVKSVSVSVEQTASAQVNTGAALKADDKAVRSGAQSFSIQSGNNNTTVSVNISAADTNKAAQQKIANAINKSGAGVTASVQYNEKTNQSSLVIEGTQTGEKNGFSMTDLYGGSLVSSYGLDFTSVQAQDAEYTLDGKSVTSANNQADLGGGVKVALTGTGTVTADLYRDTGAIKSAVTDMIDQYNNLLKTANAYGSDYLSSRLTNTYNQFSAALSKSGIYQGFDGTLQIDDQLLKKSIENGSLETALGLKDMKTSFAGRLGAIAEEVGNNPAAFSVTQGGGSFDFSSGMYDASLGGSIKQYALDLRYSNIGQLFDYLL